MIGVAWGLLWFAGMFGTLAAVWVGGTAAVVTVLAWLKGGDPERPGIALTLAIPVVCVLAAGTAAAGVQAGVWS